MTTDCLVIDIGGTQIKYGLINSKYELIEKTIQNTPNEIERFKITLINIKQQFLGRYNRVGVSMPGVIDNSTGFAVHGGSLTFVRSMNMKDFYEAIFEVPVFVENDGKSATLGEKNYGSLKAVDHAVLLVLGTGIGGGILVNGQVLKGAHFAAGEFSFINTKSTTSITDLFAFKNGVSSLLRNYCQLTGITSTEMNGKLFFNKLKQQNQIAWDLFHSYCESIAFQIFNLQMILDPETFVIGGGISAQPLLIHQINEELNIIIQHFEEQFDLQLTVPKVIQSSLGNDANLYGVYY